MQGMRGIRWMSLVLLVLVLPAAGLVTVAKPLAQQPQMAEPSSISCGDSAVCSMSGTALYVKNTGSGTSIYGNSMANGIGVRGKGSPGVYGYSYHGTGVRAKSENGYGLKAQSTNSNAVYAETSAPYGRSVYGTTTATGATGVYGVSSSSTGTGVVGVANNATGGQTYGVAGYAWSTSGTGVYGKGTTDSGETKGVVGVVVSPIGYGVVGNAQATTGPARGVMGLTSSVEGRGVVGGTYATSGVNYGVYGKTSSSSGYGVFSEGDFGATGFKSAVVQTDDYSWRHLYAMESPEVLFEDVGTAYLEDGFAVVAIEPIFAQTVNLSEPYQVFLTPQGDCGLYVVEKGAKAFSVSALDGRECSISFDYRIVAKRRGYEQKRLAPADAPLYVDGLPELSLDAESQP